MKARLKGSKEWLDFCLIQLEGDARIYESEEVEFFNDKVNINWQFFRREAAMRAMQSLINNQKANHDEIQAIVVAQNAVVYADALIEELRKPLQISLNE